MKYRNQGNQTEFVKREIINCIIDLRLHQGEQLPTQAELRTRLHVGNAVIGRAIQALTDDGVLEKHGRRGITIRDTALSGYCGRTIGLICHNDTQWTIAASFMQNLAMELSHRACRLQLFPGTADKWRDEYDLEDFSGAYRAVTGQRIDALFSMVRLTDASAALCRENGLPLCCPLGWTSNASCVEMSLELPDVLRQLAQAGYRRPFLLHMGHPETEKIRSEFCAAASLFSFPDSDALHWCRFMKPDSSASQYLLDYLEPTRQLMTELAGRPEELRPDILLIPDDVLTTWAALQLHSLRWSPPIAHLEIRQFGHNAALRPLGPYWLQDVAELAGKSVDLLLKLITSPVAEPVVLPLKIPFFFSPPATQY